MQTSMLQQRKKTALAISVYAVLFLFLILITNLGYFNKWVSAALTLFRPVLIGLVLAYLCNPIFSFFEQKLFSKIDPHGLRRTISLIFTYLVLFAIFGVLIVLIVPQLISSISDFIENSGTFLDKLWGFLNKWIDAANTLLPKKENNVGLIPPIRTEAIAAWFDEFLDSFEIDGALVQKIINAQTIGSIFQMAGGVVSIISDLLFGLFISIYLLNTKEKRYAQIMRLRRALLSEKANATITNICTVADRSFGGFLKGKLLDSFIVGILVYVAISIIGIPYAILIAAIIAITDIVPVIGPFIGVIPSAVIILLTDPAKVLPFLICILVVQQIDGNILAPKILGEHTGVSSLCVMIAITTLGNLWGLAGMVLGVPLFATVLELTSEWLDERLRKKGLSTATEDYYTPVLAESEPPREETVFAKMQKRISLRRESKAPGGNGALNTLERFGLGTYELAIKHNLFSQKDDELLQEFAAEEAVLAEEAETQIEEELAEEGSATVQEVTSPEEALATEERVVPQEEAPTEEAASRTTDDPTS